MNQEKNQKNRSPHHDGGGLLAQVQASVEILSPVPVGGKCRERTMNGFSSVNPK